MKPRKPGTTTPLDQRRRQGKILKSPFAAVTEAIASFNSSWMNERLLNVLWACVLTGSLERKHYLNLFRRVALTGKQQLEGAKYQTVCHNFLSTLEQDVFIRIFEPITRDKIARPVLSSITLIDSLPDIGLWRELLGSPAPSPKLWQTLGRGVLACLDHQSQEATDVRWLKMLFLSIRGWLQLSPEAQKELRQYPNWGDMRRARPTIRAMEIGFRSVELGPEKLGHVPQLDSERIWFELFKKTECVIPTREEPSAEELTVLAAELAEILQQLEDHFMGSISTTSVDARMDSAFGLALYSLSLTYELAHIPGKSLSSGRILLRTIAECFITLAFLRAKDDSTIWVQYRNYGAGQTALAFLKTSGSDEVPDYIDLKRLEMLANEDAWMEMLDIKIGSWASKNLREMSEEAGVKGIYDSYYDWPSGFVHGHWGSVRDAVFTTCMNPLHRLHRVPRLIQTMPSILTDCCKLCNQILDELNDLYPDFKPRINWH